MSEALDKVRGVRELPLFPLQAVLFPGMPMPLHIFEPRYRKMLADIRAGDNLFGLSYFDSAASENEIPAAGHIGCVAEVTETQALPDGRCKHALHFKGVAPAQMGKRFDVIATPDFQLRPHRPVGPKYSLGIEMVDVGRGASRCKKHLAGTRSAHVVDAAFLKYKGVGASLLRGGH